MRLFAAALEWAIFLVLFPFLLLHPRVRQGIRRRLGLYDGEVVRRPGPRVWLHGASAGDVLGLVPIVRELKALRPDARIVVSAITDSGAAMAEQRLIASGLADAVTFLPYDLPGPCRRAMAALRPDVLVLEYTELWPQLIRAASRAGVRLAMTNGRIAPENLGRYRLLFALAGNLLEHFDVLMMRADDEAERALQLGAPRDRLHVTGNTKFDALAVSVPEAVDEGLRAALGVRLHARRRGGAAPRRVRGAPARVPRSAAGARSALRGAIGARAGRGARARPVRPAALRAGRRRGRGRAGHHRRAGARLPARHRGLRGRQLHPARRPEHPRAGGLREAGAVRSAHGELPGQRAGAGRARRAPGARRRGPPADPARPARAPRGDPHPRPARARGGLGGARRERAGRAADRRPHPGGGVSGFWWRTDEPVWAEAALWPLSVASLAYRAGAALARGSVRPVKAGAPVISVGNLVVGGAGKTPVALELAERLLRRGKQPAVLSRGYGRRARHPVEVSEQTPCALSGDEPLLLKRRCPRLRVLVGPRRAVLASQAVARGADVLLLDDGLQHHELERDLDVVVMDASNPLGNGRLLPRGPLREPLESLRRVRCGLLWLTRCDLPRAAELPQIGRASCR